MQTTKGKLSLTSLRPLFPEFKDCWHLAEYIPHSNDPVSQSILQYKMNNQVITSKWNNLALKYIAQLNLKPDYVVRALGSREMFSMGEKGLDELCNLLCRNYNIFYNPFLLMKKQFTRPLHSLPKKERIKELDKIYVCNLLPPLHDPLKILIIDDVVTTGATMRAISQSVKKPFPSAELYFVALAQTKSRYG